MEDTVQLLKPPKKSGFDLSTIENMLQHLLEARGPLLDQERATPTLEKEARQPVSPSNREPRHPVPSTIGTRTVPAKSPD